jgi:hypothetical protein
LPIDKQDECCDGDENEFRILNLDYDQKDRGSEPPDGESTARNITSAAAAASNPE